MLFGLMVPEGFQFVVARAELYHTCLRVGLECAFHILRDQGEKVGQGSKADTLLRGLPQWTTSSSQSQLPKGSEASQTS